MFNQTGSEWLKAWPIVLKLTQSNQEANICPSVASRLTKCIKWNNVKKSDWPGLHRKPCSEYSRAAVAVRGRRKGTLVSSGVVWYGSRCSGGVRLMDLTAGIHHRHPSLSRKGSVMSLPCGRQFKARRLLWTFEKPLLVSDSILGRTIVC